METITAENEQLHRDQSIITLHDASTAVEGSVMRYLYQHQNRMEQTMHRDCPHQTIVLEQYPSAIVERAVDEMSDEGRFEGVATVDAYDWRWIASDLTARCGNTLAILHRGGAFADALAHELISACDECPGQWYEDYLSITASV